jgi:hypothetical protein
MGHEYHCKNSSCPHKIAYGRLCVVSPILFLYGYIHTKVVKVINYQNEWTLTWFHSHKRIKSSKNKVGMWHAIRIKEGYMLRNALSLKLNIFKKLASN